MCISHLTMRVACPMYVIHIDLITLMVFREKYKLYELILPPGFSFKSRIWLLLSVHVYIMCKKSVYAYVHGCMYV